MVFKIDNLGQIAVHFAARAGHTDIVQFLLEHAEKYRLRTDNNLAAAHKAREFPAAENLLGQTPIMLAALGGQGETVKYLTK